MTPPPTTTTTDLINSNHEFIFFHLGLKGRKFISG